MLPTLSPHKNETVTANFLTPDVSMPDCRYPDASILVVDDDPDVLRTLGRILQRAGYQRVTTSGDASAVLALAEETQPDLVLLDYHLPGLTGETLMEELRAAAGPRAYLPVLIISGDATATVRQRALAAGATDFVNKPFEITEVLLRIQNLLETRYLHRALASQNEELELRVQQRTAELDDTHLDAIERLALAAEYRDDDTGQHTSRVGEGTAVLASAMGFSDEEIYLLRRAAPLHDVGKIGVPDAILRKPGPLTDAEWALMREHTVIGARLLSGGRSRLMQLAEQIARSHHEQWDGNGYPDRLAGEKIPIAGRLVMVADVFDALLSDRVYRRAWSPEAVLDYIREHAGQRFDPQIAALCHRPAVRRALLATRESQARAASRAAAFRPANRLSLPAVFRT
jgi:putative two-component system response regulator